MFVFFDAMIQWPYGKARDEPIVLVQFNTQQPLTPGHLQDNDHIFEGMHGVDRLQAARWCGFFRGLHHSQGLGSCWKVGCSIPRIFITTIVMIMKL